MLPNFPYLAMTITGVFHLVFGFIIFIASVVGIGSNQNKIIVNPTTFDEFVWNHVYRLLSIYTGVALGCSLWIMMVGVLGILAGVKSREHHKTHQLKIAYMVTSILSAVLFSAAGIYLTVYIVIDKTLYAIGIVGFLSSIADFVMAIVSSSICCCCATSSTSVVVVQSQPVGNPAPYTVSFQQYPLQYPNQVLNNQAFQPTGPGYPQTGPGYPQTGPGYPETGAGYPQPAPAVGDPVKSGIM